MTNTEIILIVSAGATFLLAIAAFWSIWQNYQVQKRERRERLLNEIIEWCVEITQSQVKGFFKDWLNMTEIQREHLREIQITEHIISYLNLLTKTTYIGDIAKFFDLEMEKNVNSAFVNLIMLTSALEDLENNLRQKKTTEMKEYSEVLKEYDKELGEAALKVMEKTSNIKLGSL